MDDEPGFNVKDIMEIYEDVKSKHRAGSVQEGHTKMVTLAWFIYGLYLLPVRKDFVHFDVIQMLWFVYHHQEDPSNVILAETYAAISLNSSNTVTSFRASAVLFHIWIISHLYKRESLPTVLNSSNCNNVTAKARAYSLSATKLPEWRDHLLKLRRVQWRALWLPMAANEYRVTTEGGLDVTLVGLWHIASYAPIILARQFGDKQQHPGDLNSCDFLREFNPSQDREMVEDYITEWYENLWILSSRGMLLDPQPLYKFWRGKGIGSFCPPPAWDHSRPSGVKRPPQM